MPSVRYYRNATGWRPLGTNAFAAAHGMGEWRGGEALHGLGENISFEFQNEQALRAMNGALPQPLAAGVINDPGFPVIYDPGFPLSSPLNWPGDTQLTLDPNAAAIVAEQKLHANDPAIYGGGSTVPGVWNETGGPPSPALAWLEANAGWIAFAVALVTLGPALVKKL